MILLASRFEVCLSFACCLFDVFRIEKALERVFLFPHLRVEFYSYVNIRECHMVAVDGTFCLGWFSSTCLMTLLLGT